MTRVFTALSAVIASLWVALLVALLVISKPGSGQWLAPSLTTGAVAAGALALAGYGCVQVWRERVSALLVLNAIGFALSATLTAGVVRDPHGFHLGGFVGPPGLLLLSEVVWFLALVARLVGAARAAGRR